MPLENLDYEKYEEICELHGITVMKALGPT